MIATVAPTSRRSGPAEPVPLEPDVDGGWLTEPGSREYRAPGRVLASVPRLRCRLFGDWKEPKPYIRIVPQPH
jgi:hypothetical protein